MLCGRSGSPLADPTLSASCPDAETSITDLHRKAPAGGGKGSDTVVIQYEMNRS